MAKDAMFTKVWSRCPQHKNTILKANQKKCTLCEILERDMALTPPFEVVCVDETPKALTKDRVYTVKWIIYEGRNEEGMIRGYVLDAGDDNVFPIIVPPESFIPLQYMKKKEEVA